MLIKEYKNNHIFSKNEILSILTKDRIFKDNEKKIIKMPNNLYMFKRNLLNEELISKYNLDEIYKDKSLILNEEDFDIGLSWLYIMEIDEYKNKNQKGNNKKESEHILKTNKLSYEISPNIENKFLKGHNLLIKQKLINIMNNHNIELLEIPLHYKLIKVIKFFEKINLVLTELKIKNIPLFYVRFKKLKKYKKDGMFINKNLIIIDPRKPEIFFHEFGHFIYENKLNFILNNEFIKHKNIKTIIKNYECDLTQYKKLENYDLDSEKFAFWFEEQIKIIF